MNISPEIKQEVSDFLKKNNTAVVATVWQGEPHASTVHYVSDDDMSIYFLAHRNTSKYMNVSSHQRAAIVVGTGPKHISVQTKGTIDLVVGEKAEEMIPKFQELKKSFIYEHLPVEEMKIYENQRPVVFKFEPITMTFLNLDDDDYPHSKSKTFHEII